MSASIDEMIQMLEEYKESLRVKADLLAKALAEAGYEVASVSFAETPYDGPRDESVTVENLGEGRYAIVASGRTVLFLEFGAGVTYNKVAHPLAGEFGYGPTTYPGQVHAADPRGWYLPKAAGGGHSFGNMAGMGMYKAGRSLHQVLTGIAREVFG